MLSKIGAALGPYGKIASVIMQIPQIVKQVWASIKNFAKELASLFGGIGNFIKNINTQLFLFIKYNYSLQHSSTKGISVGIGGVAALLYLPFYLNKDSIHKLKCA